MKHYGLQNGLMQSCIKAWLHRAGVISLFLPPVPPAALQLLHQDQWLRPYLLYHWIYPRSTRVHPFNSSNVAAFVSVEQKYREIKKTQTEVIENTGKAKHLSGTEPGTEQCRHSKKGLYLIKTGSRSSTYHALKIVKITPPLSRH